MCVSIGWKKIPVLGLAGEVSGGCVVPAVLVAVLWKSMSEIMCAR